MRIGVFGAIALGLLTAACGSTGSQRAASGGLTGLGVGALVGGPVGAVVGGFAGAAGGALMPEGADTLALNTLKMGQGATRSALNQAGLGPTASGSSQAPQAMAAQPALSPQVVKEAQAKLQRDGLYTGYIDGIVGPKTEEAVRIYQRQQGLPQTAQLDPETLQHLNVTGAAMSGTSTPAAMMSADEVRDRLERDGYTNVSDLQRRPDNTYMARADRGNETYTLRIDARSGRVLSQRRVAANEGAAPGASNANPEPRAQAPANSSGASAGTVNPPTAGAGSSTSTSTSTGESGTGSAGTSGSNR
jgi:peptidoglycan hydrolase-like protein with peptidoglycan-binding domain